MCPGIPKNIKIHKVFSNILNRSKTLRNVGFGLLIRNITVYFILEKIEKWQNILEKIEKYRVFQAFSDPEWQIYTVVRLH